MTQLPDKLCTGCSTCKLVCPKKCITMTLNIEGFMYPQINNDVCVECGQCLKACPILNKKINNDCITKAFAAYSTNKNERLKSSSGGIFSILANKIIEKGGVVYGASFNEKFKVCHIGIDKINDLDKLRGSKYVQSDLQDIFLEVKSNLDKGRTVLFSGVICQIAGLKSYLKIDYPNLITVDVLCHGVPSPKLWEKYLLYIKNIYASNINNVSLRDKNFGWKKFGVVFEFENGLRYENVFYKDLYMKMFLNNISLRPSCYECCFNSVNRISDITLGDCWGIEKVMPDMDDDKGTSVVLLHSNKGLNYFESLKNRMIFCESKIDIILPPSSGGRLSVKPHPKRSWFFRNLEKKSIEKLARVNDSNVLIARIKYLFNRIICEGLKLLSIKK